MSAVDESKAKALQARYRDITSMRPGETEEDARRRRIFTGWFWDVTRVERFRGGAVRAQAMLEAQGVSPDDQIAMIRLVMPTWASWLAAEVVHGRKPAEHVVSDIYSAVSSAVSDE